MSAVFRHSDQSVITVSESQILATQASDVMQWLEVPTNARQVAGWKLELCIPAQLGQLSGLGRESLPFALVECLVANGIELSLAILPLDDGRRGS